MRLLHVVFSVGEYFYNQYIVCYLRLIELCDSGKWFIGGKSCKSGEVGRVHLTEDNRIDMRGFADRPQVCEHLDVCIIISGKIQMSYWSGNYPAIIVLRYSQKTLRIGEYDDFVGRMLCTELL